MSTISNTKSNSKSNSSLIDKAYMTALRQRFIKLSEIRSIAGKDTTARMIVWKLTKRGRLSRVKSGFYAAIPIERIDIGYESDRYLLMDRAMDSKGALAYHSALEIHGVAHSPFNRVFYIVDQVNRQFDYDGILYLPVTTDTNFGLTKTYREEHQIRVTDKERTFLDCLHRLDLCGGFEEFYKSAQGFKTLKPIPLMKYLDRYGEQSLYMRTGFVLELLNEKVDTDPDLVDYLKSHISKSPAYLIPGKRRGNRLNKDWNVLYPANLTERIRNA